MIEQKSEREREKALSLPGWKINDGKESAK